MSLQAEERETENTMWKQRLVGKRWSQNNDGGSWSEHLQVKEHLQAKEHQGLSRSSDPKTEARNRLPCRTSLNKEFTLPTLWFLLRPPELWGCIFLLSHPMYGSLLMQLKEMKPPCPACLPLSPLSPWFVNLTVRCWVPRALSPGQRWINTFGNWNPGSKTQLANALYGPESPLCSEVTICIAEII